MRRVAALTALVTGIAGCLLLHPTTGHAQNDPASRALRYLQSQQLPDGSIPASFPSDAPTEDTVIAAAAAGYDPSAFSNGGSSLIDYLRAHAAAASKDAAHTGKLLQAVVAAHLDPHAFGGRDLVAAVQSTYVVGTGAYGDGQTFTQSLAMLGLRSAGVVVPAATIARLRGAQDADGGWNYLAIRNETATTGGSDTNSTAMALMALDAAGEHGADTDAVRFLHTQQQGDGGFPYMAPSASDPDSDALVIQAIIAAGQDPTGCSWAVAGGATPYSNLVALQTPSGGYAGWAGVDTFTTSQTPIALLLQPFPATGVDGAAFTIGNEAQAARGALLYLRSQQSASDGSVASAFPSYAPTEDYVIAAAAAGYDPNTLRSGTGPSAVAWLRASATAASANAGQAGKLVQAVVAARLDPHAFGGQDLVSRITAAYHPATGLYGNGQTFTQALAMLGLEASDSAIPATAITALRGGQDSDGGWNYVGVSGNSAGSDTNSTAMAMMALGGVGDHRADASALAFLRGQQQSDGGFAYQGSPSDPDSSALVLQALVAAHQDPAAAGWSHGGNTVITALIATQSQSGGWAGWGGVDAFTTSQVPIALERIPFPVRFGTAAAWTAGTTLDGVSPGPVTPYREVPITGCATATDTATALPTDGGLGTGISTSVPTPTPQPTIARGGARRIVGASDVNPGVPAATATPADTPSAASSTPPTAGALPTSGGSPPTVVGGVQGITTGPATDPPGGLPWFLYAFLAALACFGVVGGGLFVQRLWT